MQPVLALEYIRTDGRSVLVNTEAAALALQAELTAKDI
jgi:hypothetical protein